MPVIDLHRLSHVRVGAEQIARVVARALRDQRIGLAARLR
ncbi:hypothetical protein JOF53_008462 [Crossiella equi]|uniref:Uncharacterized protein n=1 Tax=Crossiella equi TaxID=130796 RepID=A0ABS5AV50_9PSEU|nr:hypothetical protein [Crossiella equi]